MDISSPQSPLLISRNRARIREFEMEPCRLLSFCRGCCSEISVEFPLRILPRHGGVLKVPALGHIDDLVAVSTRRQEE